MHKLEPPDSHHLDAALGWLGLGCVDDAWLELGKISAGNQNQAGPLEVRWMLHVHKQDWSSALKIAGLESELTPDDSAGWLHRAYALRRIDDGGLLQAWAALLPAAEKFPEEPVIAFNLACYACQLQQLDTARVWLKRAIKIGGSAVIKPMALADDDLKPLWKEIKDL